ncbi:MAG: NAD(P)H-dependent glycerol-3-phosphate dehydrogenase [Candidatus Methylomirabilales bacterium]
MRVGVIGAGAWGTTLAILLAEKGFKVHLWAVRPSLREALSREQENARYLPGITLPSAIEPTASLKEAVAEKNLVLLAVPSHAFRQVLKGLAPFFHQPSLLVSATKGLELPKGLTMSQVAKEVLPSPRLAVLSGPSFAKEVSRKLPTAVVAASEEMEAASLTQAAFSTPSFRVYVSLDPLGVEIGGALKIVIAIAAGVADGLGLGYNARAALIARGLAEMARLGMAMGAKAQTFAGLAGMGDLILTATSDLSRNRQVGLMLAKGIRLPEILASLGAVAEGINAAKAAVTLAERYRVEMPICREVYAVLFEGRDPWKACETLLARDLKEEGWPL